LSAITLPKPIAFISPPMTPTVPRFDDTRCLSKRERSRRRAVAVKSAAVETSNPEDYRALVVTRHTFAITARESSAGR
jgi:hypothetical protein